MPYIRTKDIKVKQITAAKLIGGVAGQVLVAQGASSSPAYKSLSGDLSINNAGVVALSTLISPTFAGQTLTGSGLHTAKDAITGAVLDVVGPDATHGWATYVWEKIVSPAAIETALFTVPAESCVVAVQANCEAAFTSAGTTVTWSIGINGDVDLYGTAGAPTDTLLKNGKLNYSGAANPPGAGAGIGVFSKGAKAIVLAGAATGGATAGDTALTVGLAKIRVTYKTLLPLVDAA